MKNDRNGEEGQIGKGCKPSCDEDFCVLSGKSIKIINRYENKENDDDEDDEMCRGTTSVVKSGKDRIEVSEDYIGATQLSTISVMRSNGFCVYETREQGATHNQWRPNVLVTSLINSSVTHFESSSCRRALLLITKAFT